MRVVVFGASGRSGKQMLAAAQAAGHEVTAIARKPVKAAGVRSVQMDLSDAPAIQAEVQRADAVVSALASGKDNPACSTLASALSPIEGLRFVTIAGAAVDVPGDAKAMPDRVVGWIMRRVVAEMLADRQEEYHLLSRSQLAWTMLRPPRLIDAPGTGAYRLTYDTPAGTSIARPDLAKAAIDLLDNRDTIGTAPFVAEGEV